MVPMKVGDQNQVNVVGGDTGLGHGDLCSFAAVNQDAVSVIANI